MSETLDQQLHGGLQTVLREVFDGPASGQAFVLNPGDAGLLTLLDGVLAAAASRPPAPGRATIAAHADHVWFGLSLLNRWAAGEADPFSSADWEASWRRGTVTEAQWADLRQRLRHEAESWQAAVAARQTWDQIAAAGAVASAAHTAYHLGAIRQMLSGLRGT